MSESAMKRDGLRMVSAPGAPLPLQREPAGLPRLVLWKKDLSTMLGVGLRTLDRMISTGEIPAPDRRLRGRPAWLARTIHEWAEKDCGGGGASHP